MAFRPCATGDESSACSFAKTLEGTWGTQRTLARVRPNVPSNCISAGNLAAKMALKRRFARVHADVLAQRILARKTPLAKCPRTHKTPNINAISTTESPEKSNAAKHAISTVESQAISTIESPEVSIVDKRVESNAATHAIFIVDSQALFIANLCTMSAGLLLPSDASTNGLCVCFVNAHGSTFFDTY